MIENTTGILITFILYLVVMLAIGWYFYSRTRNLSDYILGGRGLNRWVAAMSAQASDMSGWLLLGLPGFAYLAGLEALWIAIGLGVGTYLNWRFVARRLRDYTAASSDAITLPDYFESRFRDRSKILRIVSAVFILIFFMIYTSSGFVAGAKLFETVFGFSYLGALVIGVLVIIVYTFLGGFMAVSWTDLIQGSLMFVAIIAVPIAGLSLSGGLGGTLQTVREIDPDLLGMFTDIDGATLGGIAIISSLAWGLGYFGQPHILARFMAIRNPREIGDARRIAMVWVVISLAMAVVVGIVGRAGLDADLAGADSERVFMLLIDAVFPALLAGVMLSAILAAVMSTADSQLLVSSSALTEDLYKVLLRRDASQTELVWVSRFAVIAIALVAFVIALDPDSSVLALVSYAWGGFGATFGPIILLSLFWGRMTRGGALAGIIAGGVTVIVWKNLSGGLFALYEIVPGFVLSVVAIVVVSLMGSEPDEEIRQEFARVREGSRHDD
ncbi:sodium/proline symporter PutP [bacterium]|nr:sodium/proline symporter PutP [bacterium]